MADVKCIDGLVRVTVTGTAAEIDAYEAWRCERRIWPAVKGTHRGPIDDVTYESVSFHTAQDAGRIRAWVRSTQ